MSIAKELSNSGRILLCDITCAGAARFLGEGFVAREDDFKSADIAVLEFTFEYVLGSLHEASFGVDVGGLGEGGEAGGAQGGGPLRPHEPRPPRGLPLRPRDGVRDHGRLPAAGGAAPSRPPPRPPDVAAPDAARGGGRQQFRRGRFV